MDSVTGENSDHPQQRDPSHKQSPFKILADPSTIIQHFETIINVDEAPYQLILVTMQRSLLLVVNNFHPNRLPALGGGAFETTKTGGDGKMSREEVIRCYMDSQKSLEGLCLAIGDHNTCLIESTNSIASATLASRLSKKLNMSRPVYVVNNIQLSHEILDSSAVMSRLYQKIFQFVSKNYKPTQTESTAPKEISEKSSSNA